MGISETSCPEGTGEGREARGRLPRGHTAHPHGVQLPERGPCWPYALCPCGCSTLASALCPRSQAVSRWNSQAPGPPLPPLGGDPVGRQWLTQPLLLFRPPLPASQLRDGSHRPVMGSQGTSSADQRLWKIPHASGNFVPTALPCCSLPPTVRFSPGLPTLSASGPSPNLFLILCHTLSAWPWER